MEIGRGHLRAVVGATMAAATIVLSLVPLGTTAIAQPESSAKEAEAKKQKIAGCDPARSNKETRDSGSTDLCVATAVEAWYHTTPASELPPDIPLDQLPEESQYPENTLHVGQRVGEEESRTYLTFNLSAVPVTARITRVIVYLPLDEDGGTKEPKAASTQACLVNEPPEEKKEGSLEPPPEAECSKTLSSAPATYEQKPRPHLELNLGPLTELITPTGGIALLPTDTETQRTRTWHLAFFAKNNKNKNAEPISARISYQEATSPTIGLPPSDPPSGSGSVPLDSGGGFVDPPSIGGFVDPPSIGGEGAPPGTIDSLPASEPQEPVETGADQIVFATEATAIRNDLKAYSVKWLVPLALLFGAVFWSFVLNQEIKLPRR